MGTRLTNYHACVRMSEPFTRRLLENTPSVGVYSDAASKGFSYGGIYTQIILSCKARLAPLDSLAQGPGIVTKTSVVQTADRPDDNASISSTKNHGYENSGLSRVGMINTPEVFIIFYLH